MQPLTVTIDRNEAIEKALPGLKREIVKTAREYIGTKWVHQGRLKGKSIDCLGLLVCIAREFGAKVKKDRTDYDNRKIDTGAMREILRYYMKEITFRECGPGDIILFRMNGSPQHLGLKTDKGMIHANMRTRFVREDSMDKFIMKDVVCCYDFRPWEWKGKE